MKSHMSIEIVSDVVCPWCIIGFKQLEKALFSLNDRVEPVISWHPFELNPSIPPGGENLRKHLAGKYGTTTEGSIAARKRLTAMGAELGFTFDYFDEMRMFNTFNAHQLLHWAGKHQKQTELKMRLFSAFFGERKAVDDPETLVNEAIAVGLDGTEARDVLASQKYANDVRQAQAMWQSMGLTAVPAFIFDRRLLLQGAQDTETFKTRIEAMLAEQPEAKVHQKLL